LNSTREHWQQNGIWTRIDSIKRIVVEPQRKDALPSIMNEYYEEIRTGRGACFMAVCRGKVAEGLDFADDRGRAVLITGLPYPPFKDARVELKRQFLDDQRRSSSGTMTGQKWYQLEAFRATNQAVGRVIRHSRDHGAVIFLDSRFGDMAARTCLSKWLQPHFNKFANFGAASKSLASFFKVDSYVGHQRQAAVQKQTEMMQKSKAQVKRTHRSSDDSEEDSKPKLEVLQDIYNVKGEGEKAVASSIYAQSSAGIDFSCSQKQESGGEGKVAVGIAPKRKKIKIAANNCTSFNDPQSSEESKVKIDNKDTPKVSQETNLAKNYIRRLQSALNGSEMATFKSCLKEYKVKNDFQSIVPILMVIAKREIPGEGILQDFKCFVKGKDLSDFHLFCNVTVPNMFNQT